MVWDKSTYIQTCQMNTARFVIYKAKCQFSRGHITSLVYCTVRKIIQVKQKSVSRSPFFYFYWYYNTRNWYWDRFFRTYKARLVWRSKHKSWCCNTSIWYCPIESMPKVGTFQSNFGIKICGANSKNSHF